jgi:hypothetical protein
MTYLWKYFVLLLYWMANLNITTLFFPWHSLQKPAPIGPAEGLSNGSMFFKFFNLWRLSMAGQCLHTFYQPVWPWFAPLQWCKRLFDSLPKCLTFLKKSKENALPYWIYIFSVILHDQELISNVIVKIEKY